jgi:hypothetical protein
MKPAAEKPNSDDNKKEGTPLPIHKDHGLKTEGPLSEKDEVKQAETRMRKRAQKQR